MGAAVFIGDELTAAGFRLTGVETVVPERDAADDALHAARKRAALVIMTADLRAHVPPAELDAALIAEAPRSRSSRTCGCAHRCSIWRGGSGALWGSKNEPGQSHPLAAIGRAGARDRAAARRRKRRASRRPNVTRSTLRASARGRARPQCTRRFEKCAGRRASADACQGPARNRRARARAAAGGASGARCLAAAARGAGRALARGREPPTMDCGVARFCDAAAAGHLARRASARLEPG